MEGPSPSRRSSRDLQVNRFGQNLLSYRVVQTRFCNEVDWPTEQRCELVLEAIDRETEVATGPEHVVQVEVTVIACLTTGHRTEHRQLGNAEVGADMGVDPTGNVNSGDHELLSRLDRERRK